MVSLMDPTVGLDPIVDPVLVMVSFIDWLPTLGCSVLTVTSVSLESIENCVYSSLDHTDFGT